MMKIKDKIFFLMLIISVVSCNKEDNYKQPQLSIFGGIYDLTQKEQLVPSQAPNGARIRMFEEDSSQSENFWCNADGSFLNKRVFPAAYRIIPEGPFLTTESDTAFVDISKNVEIKFFVEPYLRISLEGQLINDDEIQYEFTINKSSKWDGVLNQYTVLYSTTAHLDANSYVISDIVRVRPDQEESLLGVKQVRKIKNIQKEKPVYIRIGARTSGTNYFNYSRTIKLR